MDIVAELSKTSASDISIVVHPPSSKAISRVKNLVFIDRETVVFCSPFVFNVEHFTLRMILSDGAHAGTKDSILLRLFNVKKS